MGYNLIEFVIQKGVDFNKITFMSVYCAIFDLALWLST